MRLNLARTLHRSAANGPGERFVVWVQGCRLACPGCWNPDTWSFERRDVVEVADLGAEILATPGIDGVTFTGGEPFEQARALAEVGRAVRNAGLSVVVFTGYEFAELTSDAHLALLAVTDVLVAGRYVEADRTESLPWRGSSNQSLHFVTDRYDAYDTTEAGTAEIHIGADGTVMLTGFPSSGLITGEGE